jgi:taurine dioxygenase
VPETAVRAAAADGIAIRPVEGALGAEIHGVDLAAPLDTTGWDVVRQALARYGVIFFRDQALTPAQHVAFARGFGPIVVNRFFQPVEGHQEIAEVRKEPHHRDNIGGGWHTDHSYDAAPALGSVLLAREVPTIGGDTLFADLALAYDRLSSGLKATLATLRARHSSRHVFGVGGRVEQLDLADRIGNPEAASQDAVHPVVIRHPDSGRAVLYVNPGFTLGFEGWTDAESQGLLGDLYHHASQPEFTCRFRWATGSIAVWDNRRTWHLALNDYPGERRLMHRVTIEGVPLAA